MTNKNEEKIMNEISVEEAETEEGYSMNRFMLLIMIIGIISVLIGALMIAAYMAEWAKLMIVLQIGLGGAYIILGGLIILCAIFDDAIE